jgi:L-ribulose-5-phosphate 3-epimerase
MSLHTASGDGDAIRLAAITDEFSPNLEVALTAMSSIGMTGVELRVIGGKNIVDVDDAEVAQINEAVKARGMNVISIASPVLKCVLPDAPPPDSRLQQDIFGSAFTFEDQPRLARRALEIARMTGAGIVRVFSYWRTVEPAECFDRVASALEGLARLAENEGVVIGLENEAACNVGTASETARVLAAVDHPGLKALWDPANALILGENPFPDGYRALPQDRIVHVHAKDCRVSDHKPEWGPIGEMGIDWVGQIGALKRDGYRGWISLETHWRGPAGDKLEASLICGRNLRDLVSAPAPSSP